MRDNFPSDDEEEFDEKTERKEDEETENIINEAFESDDDVMDDEGEFQDNADFELDDLEISEFDLSDIEGEMPEDTDTHQEPSEILSEVLDSVMEEVVEPWSEFVSQTSLPQTGTDKERNSLGRKCDILPDHINESNLESFQYSNLQWDNVNITSQPEDESPSFL